MSRCPRVPIVTLFAIFSFSALTPAARAQTTLPPNYTASLGTNLHFFKSWNSEQSMNDLFKQSSAWLTQCNALQTTDCTVAASWDTGESALLDLDPDGWVRTLPAPGDAPTYWIAGTVMEASQGGHYPSGQYVVLYDGDGTLEYGMGAAKNVALSVAGRDVIDVNSALGAIWLKITATDPYRTGNYIRNIRVLRPGTESTYQTQPFYSTFLNLTERYGTLRFMQWGETNASVLESWSDRPHLTDARYTSSGKGVPLELMVQLSNRLHADAWLNVPHRANDDYVTQMARLVRDSLDPTLKVYIEYSNEVWNDAPGYTQGLWAQQQGVARWPTVARTDNDKRLNWHGMRTAQVCDIWKAQFGAQASRVKCVLGAQSANSYTLSQALDCPLWTEGAPCTGHGIEIVAIAPYLAFHTTEPGLRGQLLAVAQGAHALDDLFTELTTGGIINDGVPGGILDEVTAQITAASAIAQARGVALYAYEGGSHFYDPQRDATLNALFAQVDTDPRMNAVYRTYLESWRTNGGGLFMHYVNVSRNDELGSFGALEYMDQTSSPKYDALMSFLTDRACWWGCRCGDGVVDRGETCDDGNRASGDCCTPLCQLEPASTLCRGSAGVCDLAEYCTGTSGLCPSDAKSTAVCRPVANACDVAAESCTGSANGCPTDTPRDCSYLASACSSASCDPVLGCVSTAINENGTCNDGNAATLIDVCYRGTCVSGNPSPTLNALSPNTAQAQSNTNPVTWTVNGTNFVSTSQVLWGSTSPTTTYLSPTQLRVSLTSAQLGTNGVYAIRVVNPVPGGGTSVSRDFTLTNPAPTVSSVTPLTMTAGQAATTLTVNGTNFASNSDVRFGGNSLTVTSRTTTQLTATVPSSLIVAGTFAVNVVSPAPGGGTSTSQTVTVSNPVPVLTSITPASAQGGANAAQLTLTLDGSGFVLASAVRFAGSLVATTYVSATRLTAVIPASLVTTVGTANVTVEQGTPGGGTTAAQTFTIVDPTPLITSLSPTSVAAGTAGLTLTVTGSNYLSTSRVNLGTASPLTTTYVSATQLTAAVPAQLLATGGYYGFSVTTGNVTSVTRTLTVTNPVPVLTSVSPSYVTPGAAATTITLTGSSFVPGSSVSFGATALTTTYVSGTQLTAVVPATSLVTPGTANVTVVNAAPNGGTSAAVVFTINNPLPVLTSIAPVSATVGGTSDVLTVNGSSFISSSSVLWDGVALPTTFVSSTQLTATLASAQLGAAGTHSVTVSTPAPGGGVTSSATYTVNQPTAVLTSITPTSATLNAAALTLTLNGSSFVSGASATWNGTALTTTFVSSTQLTAAVPASLLTTAGTPAIVVTNPSPTAASSASQTFTVNNPAPTLSYITPANVTAGTTSLTVTLVGTNFLPASTVTFAGAAVTPTYVSATQLTVRLVAANLATAGTYPFRVTNAAPGGGTTAAVNLGVIANPAPTITSLSPTSVRAGSASFRLTVNGSNFVSGGGINFNGASYLWTFVSSTQVWVTIPATAVTRSATFTVTAQNPFQVGPNNAGVAFTVTP